MTKSIYDWVWFLCPNVQEIYLFFGGIWNWGSSYWKPQKHMGSLKNGGDKSDTGIVWCGELKKYHDHRMTHFEWNLMLSVRVMRTTHPYSIHLHQWLVMPWATLHVSSSMPELIYASNVSTLFFDPFTSWQQEKMITTASVAIMISSENAQSAHPTVFHFFRTCFKSWVKSHRLSYLSHRLSDPFSHLCPTPPTLRLGWSACHLMSELHHLHHFAIHQKHRGALLQGETSAPRTGLGEGQRAPEMNGVHVWDTEK